MYKQLLSFTILYFIHININSQPLNSIGLDFGGYTVTTPKHNLEGNQYNPYMVSTSNFTGIYYDHFVKDSSYSIKGGIYLNKQFNSIISLHIPIEYNGNILGFRNKSLLYIGYTAGISCNFLTSKNVGLALTPVNVTADIDINKKFYLCPHLGINAGFNYKKYGISISGLFHFLIPEFVKYTTTYTSTNGQIITDYNTNKTIASTIRIGLLRRF